VFLSSSFVELIDISSQKIMNTNCAAPTLSGSGFMARHLNQEKAAPEQQRSTLPGGPY
jgi:hypothetical protein